MDLMVGSVNTPGSSSISRHTGLNIVFQLNGPILIFKKTVGPKTEPIMNTILQQ